MTDQRFPKSNRLRKQKEYDRVYGDDTFVADDILVIKGITNRLETTRLGLSISRKVGNAVVRNRWKRLIREAFRIQFSELPKGLDIVVRPRKGAQCDYQAIHASIGKLLRRLDRKLRS